MIWAHTAGAAGAAGRATSDDWLAVTVAGPVQARAVVVETSIAIAMSEKNALMGARALVRTMAARRALLTTFFGFLGSLSAYGKHHPRVGESFLAQRLG